MRLPVSLPCVLCSALPVCQKLARLRPGIRTACWCSDDPRNMGSKASKVLGEGKGCSLKRPKHSAESFEVGMSVWSRQAEPAPLEPPQHWQAYQTILMALKKCEALAASSTFTAECVRSAAPLPAWQDQMLPAHISPLAKLGGWAAWPGNSAGSGTCFPQSVASYVFRETR